MEQSYLPRDGDSPDSPKLVGTNYLLAQPEVLTFIDLIRDWTTVACYVLTKENGLGLDTYDYFAIFKNTTIPTEFARLKFRYKQSFNAGAADLADDLELVELPPRITRCSNELVMDLDSIEKSANNWTDTIEPRLLGFIFVLNYPEMQQYSGVVVRPGMVDVFLVRHLFLKEKLHEIDFLFLLEPSCHCFPVSSLAHQISQHSTSSVVSNLLLSTILRNPASIGHQYQIFMLDLFRLRIAIFSGLQIALRKSSGVGGKPAQRTFSVTLPWSPQAFFQFISHRSIEDIPIFTLLTRFGGPVEQFYDGTGIVSFPSKVRAERIQHF